MYIVRFVVWWLAMPFAMLGACGKATPVPEPPKAVAPLRGAAGDTDVRVMLAELSSSNACALIRGGFHGLRAPEHPDVVTGVLWIRECEITNIGPRVTFHIAGNGWSWIDQTKSKGGGEFTVRQYVRFNIAATIRGELDIAYDRDTHVVTVWFTPENVLDVKFKTIGDIEVDREGMWSSVVGALGTAFATSPDDAAAIQARLHGTRDLKAKLANGVAVTIDLCTGLRRLHLGRPAKGETAAAEVGESQRVPVELQPDGVMLVGPQRAGAGMTLQATASQGAVRMSLVCADDAETIANEFLQGRTLSTVPTLDSVDLRTQARLEITPTKCPVVVVIRTLGNKPARFAWERPTSEIARSTGGPLIQCNGARATGK
jgi:hypothetical protein